MAEPKYQKITAFAIKKVRAGAKPEDAWLQALEEFYPVDKLQSQIKHSCPKWAFCALCHKGFIREIRKNCCSASEKSSSGAYVIKALTQLIADKSLATDKQKLKHSIFGIKGTSEYRTPNDEVEVLLALWNAGEIQEQSS